MARSTGKRTAGTFLFLLALVAVASFLFLLFAESRNLSDVPGVGEIPALALGAVLLLAAVALVLFALILIRPWERGSGELVVFEDEADEDDGYNQGRVVTVMDEQPDRVDRPTMDARPLRTGIVPMDLRTVPLGARAWGTAEASGQGTIYPFHYPRTSRHAVYANDYVDIGGGARLRLRTLLAAPAGTFRGAIEERPAPARVTPQTTSEPAPRGDDFMSRLEERYQAQQDTSSSGASQVVVQEEPAEAYYDYEGDVHDVIDVEGIGETYAARLREAGIETTARLCYEDPSHIAKVANAPRKTVETWQASSELMKVNGIGKQYAEALARAGITGIAELKRRSAQVIADQVNEYLDGLDSNVLGTTVTANRVEGWKTAAKPMRRVRMQVPEA